MPILVLLGETSDNLLNNLEDEVEISGVDGCTLFASPDDTVKDPKVCCLCKYVSLGD
jgi:hypothetical protein